jgi:demethylmacrocin O-methyltransferase
MRYHYPLVRGKALAWVQVIHGLNKVMSRPEEDVRKRGKVLEVEFASFLRQTGLDKVDVEASQQAVETSRADAMVGRNSSLLEQLAEECGTDKLTHGYLATYEKYLHDRRLEKLTIVEIGLKKRAKGVNGCESLRMWRQYFPNARVIGLDIIDVSTLPKVENTEVYQCDGTSAKMLTELFKKHEIFPDVLIDDGAHTPLSHQVALGATLPRMRLGGIYFIEDLQVCINPEVFDRWGVTDSNNTITYLKRLRDTGRSSSVFLDEPTNRYISNHVTDIALENRSYMAVLRKK